METSHAVAVCLAWTLGLLNAASHADVAHFFSPEFGFIQQHHHPHPFPVGLQPPPAQSPLTPGLLYGAPPPPPQQQAPGYPSGPFVPAPVAPTPAPPLATSTDFTLPEIIENRSVRHRNNFIPLESAYLPPDERPNYESPKPPHNEGPVYYYPWPTTSSTTTMRPSPIVVLDPPDLGPPEHVGYDYNAPPPVVVVPARPSTPAPVYLPPAASSDSGGGDQAVSVEPADQDATALRLRVKEMRCLQQQGGYLRSVLKVDSFLGAAPSVDGVDNDSGDRRCELKLSRSYVLVDIAAEDFQRCGVRTCGKDLCLRLRFPAIRGMRTAADAILTLHCKTQDRVAVKTHALKMGVANEAQARRLGTYAHGGAQNPFRTHVELLRKSPNGFTRHLDSHGAVQLGEELLLRAHVIAGDGWNHTKLTDVSLQRLSPAGELLNAASLVSAHGCVNPSMQSVCRQPPAFDPPLGQRLSFRAVMFQGMRSGDELVLSMRITGCLEANDCQLAAQDCLVADGAAGRHRRDIPGGAAPLNGTEMSEVSRISFRVVMADEERAPVLQAEHEDGAASGPAMEEARSLALTGALGFVLLALSLGIFAAVRLRK